jgi:hypothetical protein
MIGGVQVPIWATTTSSRRVDPRYVPVEAFRGYGYRNAKEMGWRILDIEGMTIQLRRYMADHGIVGADLVDNAHYQPYLNVESNNVLLNMLCPESPYGSNPPGSPKALCFHV